MPRQKGRQETCSPKGLSSKVQCIAVLRGREIHLTSSVGCAAADAADGLKGCWMRITTQAAAAAAAASQAAI